jgi:hypothetical protein
MTGVGAFSLFASAYSVMIMPDDDSRPTISVVIVVDNHCLVPIGITVPVSIDDDCLVAIGASISVSMNRHAVRSHTNANVVSQNRRYGANARDRAYNEGCADHSGTLLGSTNSKVNSRWGTIVPDSSSNCCQKN